MLDGATRARVEAIRDHGDMSIAYRQAVGEVLAAYDALLTEQDEILRSRDHMQRLATQAAMSTGEAVARLEAERAQAAPVLAAVEQWDDDHGGDHDCTACQTFQRIIAVRRAAREG